MLTVLRHTEPIPGKMLEVRTFSSAWFSPPSLSIVDDGHPKPAALPVVWADWFPPPFSPTVDGAWIYPVWVDDTAKTGMSIFARFSDGWKISACWFRPNSPRRCLKWVINLGLLFPVLKDTEESEWPSSCRRVARAARKSYVGIDSRSPLHEFQDCYIHF